MLILVCIAYAVASGILCGIVASAKGRDIAGWAICGALFGVLALIAIAGMPVTIRETEECKRMYRDQLAARKVAEQSRKAVQSRSGFGSGKF